MKSSVFLLSVVSGFAHTRHPFVEPVPASRAFHRSFHRFTAGTGNAGAASASLVGFPRQTIYESRRMALRDEAGTAFTPKPGSG